MIMFSVKNSITTKKERIDTRGKLIVALCSSNYLQVTAVGVLAFSLSCALTLGEAILCLDLISLF